MDHPRSAFGAPAQGGSASGPAKPDPRLPLAGAGDATHEVFNQSTPLVDLRSVRGQPGPARCAGLPRCRGRPPPALHALGPACRQRRDAGACAAGQRAHAAAAHARPLRPAHRPGRVPSELPRAARRGREPGLHGTPWAGGPGAHLLRAAGFMLFTELEPSVLCPVSMTYAVTPALRGNAAIFTRLGSQARQHAPTTRISRPAPTSPA